MACVGSISVELPQLELSLTATNLRQPTCGGTDGFFQVRAGGITVPYQYWLYKKVNGVDVLQENGTLIAGTLTFVGLSGGTYSVDVAKNGVACVGSISVNLEETPLTVELTGFTQPSCGGSDGTFNLEVDGIVTPYQYTLYKKVGDDFVSQATGTVTTGSPTFTGLSAGVYQVTLSKGTTCTGSKPGYIRKRNMPQIHPTAYPNVIFIYFPFSIYLVSI